MRLKYAIALLLAAAAGCGATSAAPKVVDVEGSYTYYIPYNVPRDRAEQIAMERAMIQALASKFGTLVSETTQMDMRSSKSGDNVDFWSSASTLVKGEWIETVGKPEFTPSLDGNDFVVSCKIKGKAREIEGARASLDIHILANSTAPEAETVSFKSGDKLFMQFTSPVDGWLTVYLEGADGKVFRMLPFYAQRNPAHRIEADRKYTFFVSTEGDAEQYQLTTDADIERNTLYIVFSPNEYVKPVDRSSEEELALRELPTADFRRWVTNLRLTDPKLQLVVKPITISGDRE